MALQGSENKYFLTRSILHYRIKEFEKSLHESKTKRKMALQTQKLKISEISRQVYLEMI